MKKFVLLFLTYIAVPGMSLAQQPAVTPTTQGVDMAAYPFGSVREVRSAKSATKGSIYLLEDFRKGLLVSTSGDSIQFAQSNFNLLNNNFIFKSEEDLKFLSSNYIDYFLFLTEGFESEKFYLKSFTDSDGNQLKGVYQKLYANEEVEIYKFFDLKLIPSNYNPVLDHGKKYDEYKLREEMYLLKDNVIYSLDVSERKFSKYFKENKQVRDFLKKSDLELENIGDLARIADFLATLGKEQ